MRNLLRLLPFALLLTGCDNNSAPAAFTPEMASFSNEFDFDPLRGPVKDFSQTLMNEKGEVTKRVSARISEEGCFDLLDLHDVQNSTGATLLLDANYYVDADTQQKKILLQGKCQLAGMENIGLTWETDDKGFIVVARGKGVAVSYRYDAEGYPLGKTSTSGADTLDIVSLPSKDARKKLDYTSTSALNGKAIGKVVQACDYDRHDNPVSCQLEVEDDSVSPAIQQRYTIENKIEYY
ncbi:YnfC family lipoprotein [uncultured Pluralibacter sp.]|uniref:YnfC family lipoprotein n=1 Tax=uncultured Pluralibacter sp. TaxID=1490864 RepID=UPI00261C8174|nr:YnfC family lipoprotein [uncultured Pluralibacter sp.]